MFACVTRGSITPGVREWSGKKPAISAVSRVGVSTSAGVLLLKIAPISGRLDYPVQEYWSMMTIVHFAEWADGKPPAGQGA